MNATLLGEYILQYISRTVIIIKKSLRLMQEYIRKKCKYLKNLVVNNCLVLQLKYNKCLVSFKKIITKIKSGININSRMAQSGILLMSFGFVVLPIRQVTNYYIYTSIPLLKFLPPPDDFFLYQHDWVNYSLRISLIVLSIISLLAIRRRFLMSTILSTVKKILFGILITLIFLVIIWLIPPIFMSFLIIGILACLLSFLFLVASFCQKLATNLRNFQDGYYYWVILWLVYISGWTRLFGVFSETSCEYYIVLWLGIIWFFSIGFFTLKALFQKRKPT